MLSIPLSLAALSVLVLSQASTTRAFPERRDTSIHPTISWANCTANDPPRLQCGQMKVPIDYTKPSGESITLMMMRLKSTSKGSAPLGTLLINLGGPGAPTADFVGQVAQGARIFSDTLLANYDIVGLDPRGVGLSNPVKCDPALWNKRVSLFPQTPAEYDALVAHNKAVGASCAKLTGPLINHLDTLHVVEDFELFRRALNQGPLNFFAFSYGTQVALQYAEKYPKNVGRFVLDAVTDHGLPETATLVTTAQANEATLNQFFRWAATSPDSALGGQDVAALFDALVAQAAKTPLPAPGCPSTGDQACQPTVTADDLINVVEGLVAGPNTTETWPVLSYVLAQAAAPGNNATLLSTPLMTAASSGGLYSFVAIACQDWLRTSVSLTDFVTRARTFAALTPHTRGLSQTYFALASCVGWPAGVTNPQKAMDAAVAKALPGMLLVNALYDPETSVVWAAAVAEQLPKSVLLIRNGVGHTSYLGSLTGKTRDAEEQFLLTGKLPPQGQLLDS